MGRLRKALNKGGKDHFSPGTHRRPFPVESVFNEHTGEWRNKGDDEYPKFELMANSPMFSTMVLMAFERALECGGWRAETFTEWFNKHILELNVELVQKIEGRLYNVMRHASGHTLGENAYFHWNHFLDHLRKYLYGK